MSENQKNVATVADGSKDIRKEVSDRIKDIRKKKGITQKQLANRLKISQSAVAQYENGERNPKLETIIAIAKALGCSETDITGQASVSVKESVWIECENSNHKCNKCNHNAVILESGDEFLSDYCPYCGCKMVEKVIEETLSIKQIRLLTNLSQSEFCEKYSIPLPSLRKWEQEQRECPKYVLELLEFRVRKDIETTSQ